MYDTDPNTREIKLLRMVDVESRLGVSYPTIYRLIRKGEFPKPAKIGNASVWSEKDVNDYLSRIMESR